MARTRWAAAPRWLLIDNQIDQATGTMRLKATFPNKESKLWPGDFVNARVSSCRPGATS